MKRHLSVVPNAPQIEIEVVYFDDQGNEWPAEPLTIAA